MDESKVAQEAARETGKHQIMQGTVTVLPFRCFHLIRSCFFRSLPACSGRYSRKCGCDDLVIPHRPFWYLSYCVACIHRLWMCLVLTRLYGG